MRPQFAAWVVGATLSAVGCSNDATRASRFLEYCHESCDEGLLCLEGICSVECSGDVAACTPFAPGAMCRAIEIGAVRHCDVTCTSDADCGALGDGHTCQDYHCRAGDPEAQICRVAYRDYPSGATDVPPPIGCGACDCTDGTLACTEQECELGVPVAPCNGQIDSDSISKDRAFVAGDTLTLHVTHPGDCGRHDYGLCYSDVSEVTDGTIEVHVIHDGHGDVCEGQTQKTLHFDLSPLGAAYQAEQGTDGGVISTGYGTYGFGTLSCDERSALAAAQLAEVAARVDDDCQTSADCARVELATSCSVGCSVVVSLVGEEELAPLIATIDEAACGADACPPQAAQCDAVSGVECVNGTCVDEAL